MQAKLMLPVRPTVTQCWSPRVGNQTAHSARCGKSRRESPGHLLIRLLIRIDKRIAVITIPALPHRLAWAWMRLPHLSEQETSRRAQSLRLREICCRSGDHGPTLHCVPLRLVASGISNFGCAAALAGLPVSPVNAYHILTSTAAVTRDPE